MAGQRARADDSALQEDVRRLIVDEGRSQREVAQILKCDRSTIKRVVLSLAIDAEAARLQGLARRQAMVIGMARRASIAGIAKATGRSRAGVRKIIEAGQSGAPRQFGRARSLLEQSIDALAALQKTLSQRALARRGG